MVLTLPYMKEKKWGRIINIGSISGVMGEANASVYSMTKASLIGLTKSLALELAQDNITVNIINPGWVDTELINNENLEETFSREEIIQLALELPPYRMQSFLFNYPLLKEEKAIIMNSYIYGTNDLKFIAKRKTKKI